MAMENIGEIVKNDSEKVMEKEEKMMEKEEILLQNFKDFKENLVEFNRNLIFVDDVYSQKKEEIEEELEIKIDDEKNSKIYQKSLPEFEELKQKIENCFKDFNFNSAFDVYKTITNLFETIESDLLLINSFPLSKSVVKNQIDEVFLFNLSFLKVLKLQTNIIKNNIEKLIDKTQNLIKFD